MIRIIIDREAAAQHGVTRRRYTCPASTRRSNDRTRVGCCDIQAVECDTAIQTPVRVVWCNNTPTPRLTRGPLLVQCQLDTDSSKDEEMRGRKEEKVCSISLHFMYIKFSKGSRQQNT